MKRFKSLWTLEMFHSGIDKPEQYYDELFQNFDREHKKLLELPEDKQEKRGKKIIDDLLIGHHYYSLLKQHRNERLEKDGFIQMKL